MTLPPLFDGAVEFDRGLPIAAGGEMPMVGAPGAVGIGLTFCVTRGGVVVGIATWLAAMVQVPGRPWSPWCLQRCRCLWWWNCRERSSRNWRWPMD